jgi:calcium-dependent protein kinase
VQVIGKGSFGLVLKGIHRQTKQERAIKVIKKSKLMDSEKFKSEINIMKKLDHPNIIKLYEVFEDKKYCYFVME